MENEGMVEKLFDVGAQYGYAPSRRHPSVSDFIFGSKGDTELFDLEQTAQCLQSALDFVRSLAAARKTILFVGGKAEAREALKRVAERLNQPYVASRWIGGTLTNFGEIKKRLARLQEITDMREKGGLAKFTKLERLLIDREAENLEHMFGGLKGMQRMPEALLVVDSRQESGAVAEAHQLNIPVIALINSDCDRSKITYPIPANDASLKVISFVLEAVAKTYADNLGATPAPAEEKQP